MSANLGLPFEDDENHSPPRANAGKIIVDTAENIQAIPTDKQVGAVRPTNTAAGLVEGVTYVPIYNSSFIRTGWQAIAGKHLHDADTEVAGGALLDIHFANLRNVILFTRWLSPIPSDFVVTKVGTGDLTRDATGEYPLKCATSASNNDLTTARGIGIKYEWNTKLALEFMSNCSHSSGLLARMGIGTDRIEDSQDTARRQMGIEGCDGHGTTWVIINANGNTSSLTPTPTTADLLEASKTGYALVHLPAEEVRLYKNEVSVGVSTTNVASSGNTDPDRLFIWGIKVTSGAVIKNISLRHALLLGKPSANQFMSI